MNRDDLHHRTRVRSEYGDIVCRHEGHQHHVPDEMSLKVADIGVGRDPRLNLIRDRQC